MELWMIYVIISIVAVVVEIFAPTMFCINFAIAGILTALISIFWGDLTSSLVMFVILSVLSLLFIKPILVKTLMKDTKADFKGQYYGKIVKCIEAISQTDGAVTIYDERWEARLQYEGEEIPVGADVKIVGNDSLILFVEKV